MGGKGSGKSRTKIHGDFSKQLKGKEIIKGEYRLKKFAYVVNKETPYEQKFYGLRDYTTGKTYKRIKPETWEYIERRFGVEPMDKALSRMEIYTKEGIFDRAETARGNIISALNSAFDTNAVFEIEGKIYSLEQIIKKLEDLKMSEKWMDFSTRYSDIIDSFFVGYRAEIGIAPPEDAGTRDIDDIENLTNEQDMTASDNYDKMFGMIEDLVKTFKI